MFAIVQIADMLSFKKKNAGQRAMTSFQPAIFTRAGRTRDTYTMNLKINFKVMVWITVIRPKKKICVFPVTSKKKIG